MLDLSKNYFCIQLGIMKGNGTAVVTAAAVGTINLLGKTYIQRFVKLGGK